MEIPTPNEFAEKHGFKPFPKHWNLWLNQVREAILFAQPIGGRNVTVDEHPGQGTVINAERGRPAGGGGGPATGACCIDGECSITTEAACAEAGGTYQGDGTPCDPNPCVGCHGFTTCTVSFTFNYQDRSTPPIGHAFSGSGSVILDVTDCSGTNSTSVSVTVIEHGDGGDTPCLPDPVSVIITASATYNSMTGLWDVTGDVFFGDHSVVCGLSGWPSSSIDSDFSDGITDAGGTFPLVPETFPTMTGTVTFTF